MEKVEKLPKFIKMIDKSEKHLHTWYYTLNFHLELGEYNTSNGTQDETDRKWVANYRCYDSFDSDIRGESRTLFGAADELLKSYNKHMPEIIEDYRKVNIEVVVCF